MTKALPTTCPKSTCRRQFPSRAAFIRHIRANCHRPQHISCSACDTSLGAAAKWASSLMARTEAAVVYVNRTHNGDRAKLAAFLDLFHPDMPEDRRRELIARGS